MSSFFFFNDTATTEIYTLSLHDALPIFSSRVCTSSAENGSSISSTCGLLIKVCASATRLRDRKSTRLNSSHQIISYAVFCFKKKKKKNKELRPDSRFAEEIIRR